MMSTSNNSKKQKGAAILVSQLFPPFNAIGSQRAMRMANSLINKFEFVYIVTLPTHDLPDEYLDLDFGKELLNNPQLKLVEVSPILTGYGFVKKRNLLHRFVGAFLTRLLCSPGIDWVLSLKEALLIIIQQNDVKLIVSTGCPFIPFFTVTRLAVKNRIPNIIDYRDLWSQNPRTPHPKLARYFVKNTIENYVNKIASAVTTVSEGCAKSILEVQSAARIKILPNYPDNSYKKIFNNQALSSALTEYDQNMLNIVLAGSIYEECTCRLLVEALKLIPQESRNQVIVHYFGPTSKIIEHDFRTEGMLDHLSDHGYVDKLEAIKVVKAADLLLSLVFDRPINKQSPIYGIMTTKIFDYFLSGKPILNIGPPGGDLNVLAEKIGYTEFYSFESFQPHKVAEFLLNALQNLDDFRKRKVQVELPDFSECFELILDNV